MAYGRSLISVGISFCHHSCKFVTIFNIVVVIIIVVVVTIFIFVSNIIIVKLVWQSCLGGFCDAWGKGESGPAHSSLWIQVSFYLVLSWLFMFTVMYNIVDIANIDSNYVYNRILIHRFISINIFNVDALMTTKLCWQEYYVEKNSNKFFNTNVDLINVDSEKG